MIGMKAVIAASLREHWFHRNRRSAVRREDRLPRLMVDVSVIIRHDAQTGIQRVVRAVWTNLLAKSGNSYELVPVFATKSHGYRATCPDFLSHQPEDRLKGDPICVEPGDKFLGLDLNAHLLPLCERQIAFWRARGVTTHIIVYDLLPLLGPQWFNEKTVRNFRRWIKTVRQHCDQALCISDAVADDLRSQLKKGSRAPLISRIRLAGDIEGSLPSCGIDKPLSAVIEQVSQRPAILMVGTIEPRKAYDVALAAFEHLWATQGEAAPALVIVGKPGWRTEALQNRLQVHPEAGRRLKWLKAVSDEGLAQLYGACSGVLLASHAEGFGLPGIEAAMHGCNVLVRDLPVFREQGLRNITYFSDDSPGALAAELLKLLHRPAPNPEACALASWADCVTDLLSQVGFAGNFSEAPTVPRNCAA